MLRLTWTDANRREQDCYFGALAHILHAFRRGGRRDNQGSRIGIKVIEKDRQGHRNITGRCAGKLTGKRLFNCMVHPIGQLVHLLPTFLLRERKLSPTLVYKTACLAEYCSGCAPFPSEDDTMVAPLLALVWQTNRTDQPLQSRYHIPFALACTKHMAPRDTVVLLTQIGKVKWNNGSQILFDL